MHKRAVKHILEAELDARLINQKHQKTIDISTEFKETLP